MTARRFGLVIIIMMSLAAAKPSFVGGTPGNAIDIQTVGLLDPLGIQEKFPAYIELVDLMRAYDEELQAYTEYINSQAQSYQAELAKEKEAACAGKFGDEKKAIEARYAEMSELKRIEFNQLIQEKFQGLQEKLNIESARADVQVKRAVQGLAEDKGLVIILNGSAVLYGGTDITDELAAMAGGDL